MKIAALAHRSRNFKLTFNDEFYDYNTHHKDYIHGCSVKTKYGQYIVKCL
jgi:hypothetical protein